MQSIEIKEVKTLHPIHSLIGKRWSARSFSDQTIKEQELETILEAARWAPSGNNEQPWEYYHATKGTPGFEKILECLSAGNQIWAKKAPLLLVAVANTTFLGNGKENLWALHDIGMANMQLLLQAVSMDIYGHPMAGYDKDKLTHNLELPETQIPVIVIALGFLAEADQLEEPFKGRELSPRQRKPLDVISKKFKES